MEFLSRSAVGDVPLVAFGGSDGVIRVLSMMTWKVCIFLNFPSLFAEKPLLCLIFVFHSACKKIHRRS